MGETLHAYLEVCGDGWAGWECWSQWSFGKDHDLMIWLSDHALEGWPADPSFVAEHGVGSDRRGGHARVHASPEMLSGPPQSNLNLRAMLLACDEIQDQDMDVRLLFYRI